MAHKIHVDVLDVNNNVITSIRNYACDSGVRPINYRNGVIWKRYIEIDKCIYSPKELRAWCRFVSALGFKCSFSSKQVEIEIEHKKFGPKYEQLPSTFEKLKCYTISLNRKDYQDNLHLFIGNTVVRLISYYYDANYENIYNVIKQIKLPITRLEKLLLAHYAFPYLDGGHGLVTSFHTCFELQKKLEFKNNVNNTFTKKISNLMFKDIHTLVKDKNYKQAYKLLKQK